MNNLKVRTRIIALGATALTLISPYTNKSITYDPQYSVNSSYIQKSVNIPFASCSIGDVYIIEDTNQINHDLENAIFVIDQRSDEDPNMQIYNSCNITDENVMCEIITILQKYEELYPTDWDRTTSSMINEWEIHNICSNYQYKRKRTDHVDLNNKDEEKYKSKTLTKILSN